MRTALLLFAALAAAAETRTIHVDAGKITGTIHSLQGVNAGPLPLMPGLPELTKQYREVRIDIVRTHDFFGPTDIDAKWPNPDPIAKAVHASGANSIFPNWDADPEKEASYNFGPSDRVIQKILESGAQVYYRVGRSWSADPSPPRDPAKFANIVKHVAMHYNAGWAGGSRGNIRYWEIWNEPDTDPAWDPSFVRAFWNGTPEQFYNLYEKVARELKAYDPKLKVGACGMARGDTPGPYRDGLIKFCAAHKVPLDFFSWHRYWQKSPDPHDLARIGDEIRVLLNANGFAHAESHVTEWNMSLGMTIAGPMGQASMNAAAFTAAALIYLQDSSVQRSFYYRGDVGSMGCFEPSGALRKKAYALKAVGSMLDTPQRLALTGADTHGFAAIAGRSTDGRTVQVLIASFGVPGAGDYSLAIEHLPWSGEFSVKRYRLNETENLATVAEGSKKSRRWEFTGKLPAPGVELIVLRRSND